MAGIGVPPGYRFSPTDQELITLFLENKAMGMQISEVYPFIDRLMYGQNATPWNVLRENDPWQDSELPNKKIIYVFSQLIFVNGNTKNRVVRTAGCGTWGGKAVSQVIKNSRDEVIGQKKSFTFKPHEGSEEEMNGRGRWIMHEYSLVARGNLNVKVDDYVICRISNDLPKGQLFENEESQITALNMDSTVCSNTNTETSRKRKSSSVNYDHDTQQQKKACSNSIQEQENMSYSRMLTRESDDQELFRDVCLDAWTNPTMLDVFSVNDLNRGPKEVIPYSDFTMFDDFSINDFNQRPEEVIPYSDFPMQQQFSLSDHANLNTFFDDAENMKSTADLVGLDKLATNC